jgi:hypothetical protein
MEGKVKITVIATGFDRPAAVKALNASAVQTPVDLQNLRRGAKSRAAGRGRRRRRWTMSISRRPALDLPLMSPPTAEAELAAPGAEFEPCSPRRTAFLRRQSEA